MTVSQFPYLSDCQGDVLGKIDQPEDEIGQLTWDPEAEINRAFRAEFKYLWERITSLDRNWGLKFTDSLSQVAGTRTIQLPTDCRAVRAIYTINNVGGQESSNYGGGNLSELGIENKAWIYLPEQQQVYLTRDPRSNENLRVVYLYDPPELVHGKIREQFSSTQWALAWHETTEDDRPNTRQAYVYKGTGQGQLATIDDYRGYDRRATVSGAATALDDTSYITSRPELPLGAYDAFIYGVCARLLEKLEDDRYQAFEYRRETHLHHLNTEVMNLDRSNPIQTLDESPSAHQDPLWDWYF